MIIETEDRTIIINGGNPLEGCPDSYEEANKWEFKTDGGLMAYVRYRWGCLTVSISESQTDDVMDAVRGKNVLDKVLSDDGWDGFVVWEDIEKYILGIII